MDSNLLRSWLELPPGPWPPDHYTLLGLTPGPYDAAQIESRVLERMDRLRGHQLLHPDAVTEGMNRLAQALITLTDPQGKAAYDREFRVPSGPVEPPKSPLEVKAESPETTMVASVVVAAPVFDDDIFSSDAQNTGPMDAGEATRIIEWNPQAAPPEPMSGTATFDILPENRSSPTVSPPTTRYEPEVPAHEPVAAGVDAATLATATDWLASRRRLYARLAMIRKARKSWRKLGPILGNPDDPVDRPVRVLLLLEAVAAVRPLLSDLRGLAGDVGEPGGMVAAVVRQPLVLDSFRRLLPSQRIALAIDWKQTEKLLEEEYKRLRLTIQSDRERRSGARSSLVFLRWVASSPEVFLLILAGLLLFIALLRAATDGNAR